ncbi:tetratricopeptide repeat protein [Rhodohalobacter mucosus]|uniref:Tetratricopeptide repeat protein n=1 Tax=Rhodohalobacter mucosus TaxID=2079485 RepID=A0A316TSY0_9BACT|nr:tetratricopeptide repeat protein [Rhodohalobacter mucosus]PWN06449.1 hypothetical protein DDZ15_07955 [Rhodohalobacter mucosus]
MKSFKLLVSLFAVVTLTLVAADQSHAQDDARAAAIQLYNQAQEQAGSGNFTNAMGLFRDALDVARENNIDDIVTLIEETLPKVARSRASSAYRDYQQQRTRDNATTALEYFSEAQEVGQEFGDQEVVQQATAAIPQLHYIRSIHEFRDEDYAAAMEDLDTAIELNGNYAVAYYQKAVVSKAMNPTDVDGFMQWYDQAIEVAQRVNDTRTLNNSREGAADELIFRAVTLKDERRYDRAIELLNRVENYESQSADAHYRLAEIHNLRGNWDEALNEARMALDYESGGVTDKAKIYFELGMAYKGLGQKENACSAFENARYGDFTDPANHELQFELKCEGHTPTGR